MEKNVFRGVAFSGNCVLEFVTEYLKKMWERIMFVQELGDDLHLVTSGYQMRYFFDENLFLII